jgi:2-oxoglutarate dehydrogenase E1 component
MNLWKEYNAVNKVVWCQEEPQNMGAWMHIRHKFKKHLDLDDVEYVGRKPSGTTAEGSSKAHAEEQKRIIHTALGIKYTPPK